MPAERTQVGIVGAGPAGLVLGQLLHARGIEAVVLEDRSRDYVEQRVRAGVLEQGTVDLLTEMGVGDRLHREGMVHEGIELRFEGKRHRVPLTELSGGRSITIYGQQEVVKDLIAARLADGAPLHFEVSDVTLRDLDTERPCIGYVHEDEERELECDFVAGCDGFHGVCREAVPEGALHFFHREYPFGWFGLLVEASPSIEELIYANHEHGFSLYSMRSDEISRLYLQVGTDEDPDSWPEERIWEELHLRLASDSDWRVNEGPIIEKGVAPMRSFVTEPMQYGRLFLAGDAVHIVPATGAKGLNLAVADVRVLAGALDDFYSRGDRSALDSYSDDCLRRVWRTQHFSWWMTSMLHRYPDADDYQRRLQIAQLEYVCRSEAAARTLAENYVGFDDAAFATPI
jgi:p-hydroxybenzoate 3-monooxygenase